MTVDSTATPSAEVSAEPPTLTTTEKIFEQARSLIAANLEALRKPGTPTTFRLDFTISQEDRRTGFENFEGARAFYDGLASIAKPQGLTLAVEWEAVNGQYHPLLVVSSLANAAAFAPTQRAGNPPVSRSSNLLTGRRRVYDDPEGDHDSPSGSTRLLLGDPRP